MKTRSFGLILLCVLFLGICAGCASQETVEDLNKRLTSMEMARKKPPDATYVVDPPDGITVEVINQPEMTTTQQVRQDGIVTLPHIGETEVAGLTTKEIKEKLENEYTKYYKDPEVVVTVSSYESKHIFIYGEVGREGQQPYTGYQTLADAIGSAGGVSRFAATSKVKVIRGDPDNPEIYKIDLDDLLYDGDTLQNVSLAENDVVYVPPTILAKIGYTIEAVLFPFRSMFSAYRMGRSVDNEGRGYY